jgi:hypothetical protein
MSPVGPVAVGLVVLWLLATIAYQYAPFRMGVGRFDVFKMLPSWSFFAPRPATRDSHIVVRDLLLDGTISAWRPVSFFPTRAMLQLIWHPAKRPRKILRDASKAIKLTRDRAASKDVIQCSLPYLIILHYCNSQIPRAWDAIARQFAIVETSGRAGRRIWITFISEFHRF